MNVRGLKPISVAGCCAIAASLGLAACGGAGDSAKPWAARSCKTLLPDWRQAKSDYAELMAAVSDPAKPSGTLTWGKVANEFGRAGNDLNSLSGTAPGGKASQALSSAGTGAGEISQDADLWAAGTMAPGQTYGDNPHATIATISGAVTTYCG